MKCEVQHETETGEPEYNRDWDWRAGDRSTTWTETGEPEYNMDWDWRAGVQHETGDPEYNMDWDWTK